MNKKDTPHPEDFNQIVSMIQTARFRAFAKVNEELINLYYNVGKFISQKVENAEWGTGVVDQLAQFIKENYPEIKGFTRRGLYRMKQFYETYNPSSECYLLWENEIKNIDKNAPTEIVTAAPSQFGNMKKEEHLFVSTVLTQIPWSHHLEILSGCKSAEEKLFYLIRAQKENWNMRELRRQIRTAVFERSVLTNKIVSPLVTHLHEENIFRDTYVFEFLDLPKNYSEKDLRKALVHNLKDFILELGKGFSFVGEEYRVEVGNHDYYIDLLFFHRELRCLVAVELKIEEFQPEFIGKMNFYLEALDRELKKPHENPSVGILLCKGKNEEVVEFAMARNISPTMIATYETKLIDKKLLRAKLHELIVLENRVREAEARYGQ